MSKKHKKHKHKIVEAEKTETNNVVKRTIIVTATIVIVFLSFSILSKLSSSSSSSETSQTNPVETDTSTQGNNVSIEDGKQIITIDVRGGYNPRVSTAKAGIPTILRFKTNGSFGCASSIYLPSMNYRTNLPLSGNTDIPLPTQSVGVFRGMCGMGMYNFVINFQ
ncbi:MAG: cupredoxin domain-containing protein [Candidatus Paceibacterota bacterium]|jgi:plastocyanin domain-containing protein